MSGETKVFCGLRLFFAICFGAAVLCVVTVYYPWQGSSCFGGLACPVVPLERDLRPALSLGLFCFPW